MDPNLSQLDPKLREAYQRVLNGQNNQPTQGSDVNQPQTPPANPNPTPSSSVYESPIQTPPAPQPAADPSPAVNPQSIPDNNPAPSAPQPSEPMPVIPEPTPVVPQAQTEPLSSYAAPAQSLQIPPVPQFQSASQSEPVTSSPLSQPQTPAMPSSPTQVPTAQNIGGSVAFNASGQTQTVVKKGGKSITHILLGLGAVVFLVAYTFLWIFIFKIRLPFLPA